MPRTEYQGKRGASAGDEYHELWALRRALELVVPGTRLCAVTVEGVLASDEQGVSEAVWDGVDTACYFGEDIDRIDAVELVQLKYSGSAPDTKWTVARLARADNNKKTNALIYRLATAWKAMRERRPELHVAKTITVKLVSNQPVADDVTKALLAAASHPDRKRLHQASGLNSRDFKAFVAALDLSECGGASRFAHEERVIEALSQLTDGDVRTELDQLREFIRKRMRPEGQGQKITAESIFGLFGHADRRSFFPCPSKIQKVDPLIPRSASDQLRDLFVAGTLKLCLHGAGGEGKTTVLQDLVAKLPTGSELIVYDCYGEGTYLDANGYRHRAADAFLELANDCAARTLLPPLFAERGADHPRRFATKLAAAAKALAVRSPKALLVVAVDAADNAVTAATQCSPPEPAFVHDFVRLGCLPDNVRLLLTARTGRLTMLDLPADVTPVPLTAFEREESKRFAESRLGPLSDDWHAEFHELSGGNPRVQHYAIEFAGDKPEHALDFLNPNGKDLGTIFAARMEEARLRSGSSTDLEWLSAALVLLPRPVPLDHLAGAANFDPAHARDIVLDLAPGLTLHDECVSFADEDFEDFVRRKGSAATAAVTNRAADRLMDFRQTDDYAARHVANMVLRAGRRDTVLALVREDPGTYPITDPAARGEVHRWRLRAAMHVCRETGNTVDASALLLEGAHAIKTDEAVRRTLINELELAANFSRDHIIALVLRERDRRAAHGGLLMQLIGIDGVAGDRIGLRANCRAFDVWNEQRSTVVRVDDDNSDRRRQASESWELHPDNIAAMMVGLLHTDGVETGPQLLARPRPARFRYEVLVCLLRRLTRRGDRELLRSLARALPRRHIGRPMIELALGLAGEPIDVTIMLTAVEREAAVGGFEFRDAGATYSSRNEGDERIQFLLDACDLIAAHGGDHVRLGTVLDQAISTEARTLEALNRYTPYRSDAAIRAYALVSVLRKEEVSFERFLIEPPPTPAPKRAQRSARNIDHEREKAKELFEPILALHETRARVLAGEIDTSDAPKTLAKAITKLGAARRYRHREYEWRPHDDHAVQALLTLCALPGIDRARLFGVIRTALGQTEGVIRTSTIALLRRASIVPEFRELVTALTIECCEILRERRIAAEEKIDYLVEFAKLLLPIDREAARYSFNVAIGVAGEVDTETLHAIEISAPIAARAHAASDAPHAMRLACEFGAVAQDAALRLGDSDHFPWNEVASTLAALSPSGALAASARYAELDLFRSKLFLASILEKLLDDGSLDISVHAAFLPILGSWGDKLAARLIEHGVASARADLVDVAARQIMCEQLGEFHNFAALARPLTNPQHWTRALISTAKFLDTKPVSERPASLMEPGINSILKPSVQPVDSPMHTVTGVDGVASFIARVDAIVAAEASHYVSRREAAEKLLAQVPSFRVATFLDIVCAIPPEDYIVRDIAGLLSNLLARWCGNFASRQWARDRLLSAIETRLPEFLRYIQFQAADLEELLRQTGQTDNVITTRILTATERHIEDLSSHDVFRLVGLLANFMRSDEALGVLERHLDALLRRVPPDDRKLPGFDELPIEPDRAVARFLFAELGNIDHTHRWRAAHSLRHLARLGRSDLLEVMRTEYERVTEPCFGHPEAPFYFLAARLWFALSIARIAWESPAAIQSFTEWLVVQGERADFPHLLIRQAFRHALEGLAVAAPAAFDAEMRTRVTQINESSLEPKPSRQDRWVRGFDRYHPPDDESRRFRFDSLDTLPYWYTPLLRCFAGPDPSVFLDRAERWIVDLWKITGDAWDYDKFRGNSRFSRSGLDRSHNGHGALPAIERYRTHLEWHAMFVAGGELLAEWPLVPLDDEDNWDYLPNWLARHGPTLGPIWLADLRDPKPLDPENWWAPDKERWLRRPSLAEMRRALGLEQPDWMVLSGHRSIRYGELSGSVRIESALVSRENATALRLALEASENSHQYRLAINDDLQDELAPARFVLKPLLADQHGDTELDIHDELRGDVTAPSQLPHRRVLKQLAIFRDLSHRPIWRDTNGETIIFGRAWSDPVRSARERYGDFVSGDELVIRRDALRRVLELEGLDLITNLTITRRIGEPSYARNTKTKEREFDHIIVFRHDGTIEAQQGNLGRWT